MSYPTQQMFRPVEANIDLSRLQYSDYPNQGLQVADYSNIEYLKQSDSEEEMDDDAMNYTHGDSAHADGAGGVIEEVPQSPTSPTSPTEGSTPLSKKTAKNKAKKAKQKAKAKEKKAAISAVASGESAPSSRPETPMSPLSPTSPMSSFFSGEGGNDSEETTSSKSKSKKKKKKAKKSGSSSGTASPSPELAAEPSYSKDEESVPVPEPQIEETKAGEPQVEETKAEETKAEESIPVSEPQVGEAKAEEPELEETKAEEPTPVPEPEAQLEEAKAEEPEVEQTTAAEPTPVPEPEAQLEEAKAEEPQVEQTTAEESTPDPEPQVEEAKAEEPQVEETKAEEPQVEETKAEESIPVPEPEAQLEEAKTAEPQLEETKAEESIPVSEPEARVEEPQNELGNEEAKAEESIPIAEPQVKEAKVEEPQVDEPQVEESQIEPQIEDAKAAESIPVANSHVEEAKVEEPQAEETQSEQPKVEEAKEVEPQVEETKPEEPEQASEPILDSSVYSPPVVASEEPQSIVEEPAPAEKSDGFPIPVAEDIPDPEPTSEVVQSSESNEQSSVVPEAPIAESHVDSVPDVVTEEPKSVETVPTSSDDTAAPETKESSDPAPASVIVESSEPNDEDDSKPVIDSNVEEAVSEEPRSIGEPIVDALDASAVSEVKETSSSELSSEVVDVPETKESGEPTPSSEVVEPEVLAEELQTGSEQPVPPASSEIKIPASEAVADDMATTSAPTDEDTAANAETETEIVKEEAPLPSGDGISSESKVGEDAPAISDSSEVATLEPHTEPEIAEEKLEDPVEPSAAQSVEEAVPEPEQASSDPSEAVNIDRDTQSDEAAPEIQVEASEEASEKTGPLVPESQPSESQTIVEDAQPEIEEASGDASPAVVESTETPTNDAITQPEVEEVTDDAGPVTVEPQPSEIQQIDETAQPEAKESEAAHVAQADPTVIQSTVENEPVSTQNEPEVVESQAEASATSEAPIEVPAAEPSPTVIDTAPAEEQIPEPTASKDETSTPVDEAKSEEAQPESTSAPAPIESELEPIPEASIEHTPAPISDSAPVESEVSEDTPKEAVVDEVGPSETAMETPQGDAQQSEADIVSSEQVEEKAAEPVVEEKTKDVTGKTTLATPFDDIPTVRGVGENHVASINHVCASLPKSEASSRSRGDDVEKQTDGEVAAPSSSIELQDGSSIEEQQSSDAVEGREIPAPPAEDEDIVTTVISNGTPAVNNSETLDSTFGDDRSAAEKSRGASTVEQDLDSQPAVSISREDDQLADSGVVLPEGDVTGTSVSQEGLLADKLDDFIVIEKSDIPASSQVEDLSSQEATAAPVDIVHEEKPEDITPEETISQETPTEEVRADSDDSQQPAGNVPESSTVDEPEPEDLQSSQVPVEQTDVSSTIAPAEDSISHESVNKEAEPQPASENDSDGKLAAEVSAIAAGSLLVAPAVMEATREGGKDSEVSRDISEGIPTEPSAHDLPPYSPSPTPDAAQTVEPAKKPSSAGSQYGTFKVSDQQEAQQASAGEREERVSDGAESSARSLKDVVVKDEVVKPSATSTTPDTLNLEPPSGPEAAGDFDDSIAVQPKADHSLGSGEGDENRGEDHEVDAAVVKDTADEKEVATHSENLGPDANPPTSQVESESEGIREGDSDSISPSREEDRQSETSTLEDIQKEATYPPPQPEITLDKQENAAECPPADSTSPEDDLEATAQRDGNSELPVVVTEEEESRQELAADTEMDDSMPNMTSVSDQENLALLPLSDDQIEEPENSQTQDDAIQSQPDLETTSKDEALSPLQLDAVRIEDPVQSEPEQHGEVDAAAPRDAESPPISHDQPIDVEDDSSELPQETNPLVESPESEIVDEAEAPSVEEPLNSTPETDSHEDSPSEQPQSSSEAVSGNIDTENNEAVESSTDDDTVILSTSEEAQPVLAGESEPVSDSQGARSLDQGESEESMASEPHDAQASSNLDGNVQETSDLTEVPQETTAVEEAASAEEDSPVKQMSSNEQQDSLDEADASVPSPDLESSNLPDSDAVTDAVAMHPGAGDPSEVPDSNAQHHPLPDQDDESADSQVSPTENLDIETPRQPDSAPVEDLAITDVAPDDSKKALEQDSPTSSLPDHQESLPESQEKDDCVSNIATQLETIPNQSNLAESPDPSAPQADDSGLQTAPVVEAVPTQIDEGQPSQTTFEDLQVSSGQEDDMPEESIQDKSVKEPSMGEDAVDESGEIIAANGEESTRNGGELDPESPKQVGMSQENQHSPPFTDVADKQLPSSEAVLEETPAPESTADDQDDSGVNLEPGDDSLLDDSQSRDIDTPTLDDLQKPESDLGEEILQETSQSPEIVEQPAPDSEQPESIEEDLQKHIETGSAHSIGQADVEGGDQEPGLALPDGHPVADSIAPQEGPEDEPEASSQTEQQNETPDEIVNRDESNEAHSNVTLSETTPDAKDEDDLEDAALATGSTAAVAAVAAVVAHEISSGQDQEEKSAPQLLDLESERPRTADKASGSDGAPPADLEVITPQEPLHGSSAAVDQPAAAEQDQESGIDQDFKPRPSRRDSSTQTDELWRPKTPLARGSTPAVVLSDPVDHPARDLSRARVSRRLSKRSAHQAEEVVAAAVIIRAAADTLGDTSSRMADAVKDLKQPGDANAPSSSRHGRRSTGDANSTLRGSSANRVTGVDRTSKSDDKALHPPRTREHRSSHGSRSSRPSTRDSAGKPHRHSSHRHRHEGDGEAEQDSPQTPPKTAESGHSSHRSKRERTPQEQAEHDKRKEERRLAREKEREKLKTDSPTAEAKGKEVETPPSADRSHRSSRRHSSTRKEAASSAASTSRAEASAPPAASRKFFDLKNGQSVVDGTFGGPLTAETSSTRSKDASLKRTSTVTSSKGVQRSLSQSNAKLQKARVEESVKASKDKEDKERTRDNKTSNGHKSKEEARSKEEIRSKDREDKRRQSRLEKREEAASSQKEEKRKSGGLKGMFKKLFS